jgi:hypothetical protein
MSTNVVGSYQLLDVNVAASGALAVFAPVLVQLDISLNGPFGLGALQTDISAQFNAALEASVALNVEASNPLANFQASLEGLAQLQASLQAALILGVPTVSAELSAAASAQASIVAALGVKLGGIKAVIDASLSAKMNALNFISELQAHLGAGPVFLLAVEGGDLATAGSDLQALFNAGLDDNVNQINSNETVYGLVLVTKSPSAWAAIQATMRTS